MRKQKLQEGKAMEGKKKIKDQKGKNQGKEH